jgi:mono/diheme cytochrome c family protein
MQCYAKQVAPVWWTAAVAFFVSVLVGSATFAVHAEQGKTAKDSVYSAAQAKRGEAIYTEQCSACHGADLSGGGAPALAGADFLGFWDKTPVADLVEKIVTSMPASSPGSLSRPQGADIVAYVLQSNKFPAGEAELPNDAGQLKVITIVK